MGNYTPEQVEAIAAKLADSVSIDNGRATGPVAAPMLYAYAATLRQQAGRVDEVTDAMVERAWLAYDEAVETCAASDLPAKLRVAMRAALTAALAQNTQVDGGEMYVEARQCEDCDHLGLNDCSDTASACGDCEWQGPTPAEDKCPGCGHENCMAVACPICGGRYRFLADRRFYLHAERARVPDGMVLVPREPTPEMLAAVEGSTCSVRVAEDDSVEYPLSEDECAEIYRNMLAAAPSQREVVK